ncbi:hypothetical protein L804_06185 [Cryptococcus deuterogattii 2001/935-1]|nr:hypothetical protein L804_06185 [Cryptococcus deuterogattii 2001/935-1]
MPVEMKGGGYDRAGMKFELMNGRPRGTPNADWNTEGNEKDMAIAMKGGWGPEPDWNID